MPNEGTGAGGEVVFVRIPWHETGEHLHFGKQV